MLNVERRAIEREGVLETSTAGVKARTPKTHGDVIKTGFRSEKHRLAVCAATRAAVEAGAFEIPPRAGSSGARLALDALLGEADDGRELLADAARHTGGCYRRVPGRPQSVGCSCPARCS